MNSTDAGAHSRDELHNEGVAHEHSDVNIRAIIAFAVGLIVVAVLVQFAMWLLFGYFERTAAANDPRVSPLAAPPPAMPRTTTGSPFFGGAAGPQLVTDEPTLLKMLRDRENRDLHTYGWVDQQGGVARVPIDQAEKLLLQRGLPSRPADQVDPILGTDAPAFGESSSGRRIAIPKTTAPAPVAAPAGGQQPGAAGQGTGSGTAKKPGGGT